jgi:hypothetical protein
VASTGAWQNRKITTREKMDLQSCGVRIICRHGKCNCVAGINGDVGRGKVPAVITTRPVAATRNTMIGGKRRRTKTTNTYKYTYN